MYKQSLLILSWVCFARWWPVACAASICTLMCLVVRTSGCYAMSRVLTSPSPAYYTNCTRSSLGTANSTCKSWLCGLSSASDTGWKKLSWVVCWWWRWKLWLWKFFHTCSDFQIIMVKIHSLGNYFSWDVFFVTVKFPLIV